MLSWKSAAASLQDAVRGDFNELSKLLIDHGGKVWSDGQVTQPQDSCALHLQICHMPAHVLMCFRILQLVSLDQSQFSGALVRIPSRDLTELEPDWEIDPAGLVIMDKLGAHRINSICIALIC